MRLQPWDKLPDKLRTSAVRPYYEILSKKRGTLLLKRVFDVVAALFLLAALSPIFLILALAIKLDSPGPVFYRQTRVTQNGKCFRIFKFRSMTRDAERQGTAVTVANDARVTRVGTFLRKYRLDEIPQLLDVLRGTMTFVGTRPEVPRYVESYSPEMMATLLLPAGVVSWASIFYKDEANLLDSAKDADKVYVEKVLPAKMRYNLVELERFGVVGDVKTMFEAVAAVLGKVHNPRGFGLKKARLN